MPNSPIQRLLSQWNALNLEEDLGDKNQFYRPSSPTNRSHFKLVHLDMHDSYTHNEICNLVESARFRMSPEKSNHYLVGSVRSQNVIEVEREQVFKTLYWDFERYLLVSSPMLRLLATTLVIIGFLLLAMMFLQSFHYVWDAFFT